MHPEVRLEFPEFSEEFEGRVPHLYLDMLGLPTVGVGCLVATPAESCKLPWRHPDGSLASPSAIVAEWKLVQSHQELKKLHYKYATRHAKLRLSEPDVDALTLGRLDTFESFLERYYPEFDLWPAPAQLATLSMSWAMGPGFPPKWKNHSLACRAQNWPHAAATCKMRERNGDGSLNVGLIPRNKKNVELFLEAARVAPGILNANQIPPAPPVVPEANRFDRYDLITDEDRAMIDALQIPYWDLLGPHYTAADFRDPEDT
jgi:GH24 family phage-related lysozyme (muramidase)